MHWERRDAACVSVVGTLLEAILLIIRGDKKYEHNVGMTVAVA